MSKMFIGRFVASILALLIASSMLPTYCQSQSDVLSDHDEAEILEWLIHFEIKPLLSGFGKIRSFSPDNIGPVITTRIAKHSVSLMTAHEMERMKQGYEYDYVIIRSMDLRGGIVVVGVSNVTESRVCISLPVVSRERSFTYEFQKSPTGWIGKLVRMPTPFHFNRTLATTP